MFFWITMLCSFTVLAELPWELAEGKWKGQSEKYRGGMMKVGMKFYATGKVHYMRSETLRFHTADDNRLWEGIWAKEPGFFGKKSCPTAPDDADSWGVVTFQFNEAYTEFEGSWDYCGEGKKFKWTGKRKAK